MSSTCAGGWPDGSSPRGRGTPGPMADYRLVVRVIPAWAGNTGEHHGRVDPGMGHPRVGGEHAGNWSPGIPEIGSSPRGRGTLVHITTANASNRVIPAWAGNTWSLGVYSAAITGHPRVGGEHPVSLTEARRDSGSSPRGRGTLVQPPGQGVEVRVIPAWAGNTGPSAPPAYSPAGHPRVGGEHGPVPSACIAAYGSSPRGRGTLPPLRTRPKCARVIPAWAGNTSPPGRGTHSQPGHPRMGGEHALRPASLPARRGSSPRGRGTLKHCSTIALCWRVIPAWAGNTIAGEQACRPGPGHPRVGGEHLLPSRNERKTTGSSPRGRGTLVQAISDVVYWRVIPAWAGNTRQAALAAALGTGHPRVGGEHRASASRRAKTRGSSPRGRGTPLALALALALQRVIPAWAGNTRRRRPAPRLPPGHPRVGGEHFRRKIHSPKKPGSSPRGRGTLSVQCAHAAQTRVIPAWAGNTRRWRPANSRFPGHPRVGGEHEADPGRVPYDDGSSPRGRGTPGLWGQSARRRRVIPAWAGNTSTGRTPGPGSAGHPRVGGEHQTGCRYAHSVNGSSPRGRGTQVLAERLHGGLRVIPAWAGNTRPPPARRKKRPGHPRVGGEHISLPLYHPRRLGSSPRGRGTRRRLHGFAPPKRVIPAWAGNTVRPKARDAMLPGHPRVGGEHSGRITSLRAASGSSPRGRGTRLDQIDDPDGLRVIPAWAGNTTRTRRPPTSTAGHPRVGGEHDSMSHGAVSKNGSSPRGRGTLLRAVRRRRRRRVIPAWAGNTVADLHSSILSSGHPRVGGEHNELLSGTDPFDGSSPRGRGTLKMAHRNEKRERVIPAWAGNTCRPDYRSAKPAGHPRVGGEHPLLRCSSRSNCGSSPRGRGTR